MTKRATIERFALAAVAVVLVTAMIDIGLFAAGYGAGAFVLTLVVASLLALLAVGSFGANTAIFGRVIDGRGVIEPIVAITFDDGPSPESTPPILDALRAARATATFFVLGKHARRHPELIERIVREGHEIGNHGFTHSILVFARRRRIARELLETDAVLRARGVPPTRFFRAPHGFRNPLVQLVANALGIRVVGWSKGVFDTAKPGADEIARRSVAALHPGAVLLLHDGDGNGDDDRLQTAAALPAVLTAVRDRGLRPVTISELAAATPVRRRDWKRVAIVIASVAALVTLAFERIDRDTVVATIAAFHGLSVPLVIAALLANLASVWFKAVVWKAAIDTIPGIRATHYRQVVPAIFIGFLLNSALVARLGEVGRMVVLRRRLLADQGVAPDRVTIAGTLVMEQIVLGVTLVLLLVASIVTIENVPKRLVDAVLVLLAVMAALVIAVGVLEIVGRARRRRDGRSRHTPTDPIGRFVANAESVLHGLARGQQLYRDRSRLLASVGAGVCSWAAQLAGIWLTLEAFGVEQHGIGSAAVVFLASNLIMLVQVTPGNIGVFQFAVASALALTYGVSRTTGVTFAIGLQAIEVALGAGLGFVFLSIEGLSLGDVRRAISTEEADGGDAFTPPRPLLTRPVGRLTA